MENPELFGKIFAAAGVEKNEEADYLRLHVSDHLPKREADDVVSELFGDVSVGGVKCESNEAIVPSVDLNNPESIFAARGQIVLAFCVLCGEGFEISIPSGPSLCW